MLRISCLHSLESNVSTFEAAKPEGVELLHHLRPNLLADAKRAGVLTDAIGLRAVTALLDPAAGTDAVLLTCSTAGLAVSHAGRMNERLKG